MAHPPPDRGPRSGPPPSQEHHAQQGRGLHPGGHRAQDDARNGAEASGQGQPRHDEADHDGIVVRAADKRGQRQRASGAQQNRLGRVASQGPGQGGRGRHDQGETRQFKQAEQHDVGQDLVPRRGRQGSIEGQEGGAVGRRRVRPHRGRHAAERRGAQDPGAVVVGIDVVTDHLALPGVAVDVPAEQRRSQHEGHGPNGHHEDDLPDWHAMVVPQVTQQADPDPGQQDEAAVDGEDGQERWVHRVGADGAEQSARHAEEPRAGQVRLEGDPAVEGAHGHRQGGNQSQGDGPAQTQCRGVARHLVLGGIGGELGQPWLEPGGE